MNLKIKPSAARLRILLERLSQRTGWTHFLGPDGSIVSYDSTKDPDPRRRT